MFDQTHLALRHWLRLMHYRFLTDYPAAEADVAALIDVDASTLPLFCSPLQAAMQKERIPLGDDLNLRASAYQTG